MYSVLAIALLLSCPGGKEADNVPADTLVNIDVEEAVVVASPKETAKLRRQPVSVSIFGREALRENDVCAIKGLSAVAPNFFLPDYGSRITSAVYIRGIGSRINTPAVGLYVDNVPYVDKSSYDFHFLDVDRVDILRGPQGTLYGRNTMGGLMRVFTADPFARQGTDLSLGASTRNGGRRASFSSFFRPADKLALSVGAYYDGQNGFFRNVTTGRHADASDAAGGRIKVGYRPTENVRIDWNASYEYSDEGACPYKRVEGDGSLSGIAAEGLDRITSNRPSHYKRNMLNTGASVEWAAPRFLLSSITSWQYLADRLFMDQDFIAADIFTLEQKQRMQTFTEEFTLRSRDASRWQWTAGAFFMHQSMTTRCPVVFYADGVEFLNGQIASAMPEQMPMSLELTGNRLPFNARLRTPSDNVAVFHQSVFRDFLLRGLSLTAGVRLDYDRRSLDLSSYMDAPADYRFAMESFRIETDLSAHPRQDGRLSDDSWQLLPKAGLQYELPRNRGNVYVTVSKGYRSGGYNIQSYSDLSQLLLRREIMLGVKEYSTDFISRIPYLPQETKDKAIAGMNAVMQRVTPSVPDLGTLAYKPEQSWNYEAGAHLNFFDRMLTADCAVFFMQTHDQQLARFSDSGMGRVMVNAGKSHSCGLELGLRSLLLEKRLSMTANYGYTHSVFASHNLGNGVDYTSNYVPYIPEHTLGASVVFGQPLRGKVVRKVTAGLNLTAAGRIRWDEANTYSQPFYALVGARVGVELPEDITVSLWGKNLTGTRYNAFMFDSMSRRFAQSGLPAHFGIDISVHL